MRAVTRNALDSETDACELIDLDFDFFDLADRLLLRVVVEHPIDDSAP